LKYFIFVIKQDKKESFVVKRPEKYGGNLEYFSYDEVEKDFIEKKLHPMDLKNSVAIEINKLLEKFQADENLKKIHKKAYPDF
jgi:tyrosyl-tRNA synthetase